MIMANILIIGASSGIGRELAMQYGSFEENSLWLISRTVSALENIVDKVVASCYCLSLDITSADSVAELHNFISKDKKIDLVIYSAGFGEINPSLGWDLCEETLAVNVLAFTKITNFFFNYFSEIERGHFAAISSIGGLRGFEDDSGYSASKKFMSHYLEGMARKARKEKLAVKFTTILPGFVDTKMAKGEGIFWKCSAQKAAEVIISGLRKGKRYIFVTKRWRLIAFFLRMIPHFIFERL